MSEPKLTPEEIAAIKDGTMLCVHGVAFAEFCDDCAKGTGEGVIHIPEDTCEITMTAAEYAVFRERAHSAFRTPGWESPELRVMGPEA